MKAKLNLNKPLKTKGRKISMDKKEQLLSKMKQYAKKGVVDITQFRLENPKDYNLLAHHFGGINKAIDLAGLTKVSYKMQDQQKTMSIRDMMAYDMFHLLYAKKSNINDLSHRYSSNNETVSHLYNALYESSEYKNESEKEWFTVESSNSIVSQDNLRDKMTLDYLITLREQYNETLEVIGKKYNCSRSAIDQLHRALIKKLNKKVVKKNG